MELGKILKDKRIEKNITLDELQTITKIQKRYLEAVEEGNYDILPGKFYARAFLRQYAEAVGLDSEELFDEYAEVIPKTVKEEVPVQLSRSRKKTTAFPLKNTTILFSILPKILVFILVIGLAVSIWIFLQDSNGDVQSPPEGIENNSVESEVGQSPTGNNNDDDVIVDEENPAGGQENPEDSTGEVTDSPTPAENTSQLTQISQNTNGTPYTTYELEGSDEFIVTIQVKPADKSYIGIKNGIGKSFYAREMNNETVETFDFSSEKEIEFNIGNTQGITLMINNQAFSFPLDKPHQRIKIVNKKEIE